MFTSVEIVLRGVDSGVILEFVVMLYCLVFNIFVNPISVRRLICQDRAFPEDVALHCGRC